MQSPEPTSTIALISCDVFDEELSALTADLCLHKTLEMGLHDSPQKLHDEVMRLIREIEKNPCVKTIILAYGICGSGLLGIHTQRCQLVIPRAHDCISILLGSAKRHSEILGDNPGVYFYSPGWVRDRRVPGPERDQYLRKLYMARHGDDEELVDDLIEADRDTFAHHNCAAYVDFTQNTKAESYCKDCAKSLNWDFRRLDGDPRLLKDLLSGPWDNQRFLVLNPGERTVASGDDAVIGKESVS